VLSKVGTLGAGKKAGMKISKEWSNNEVSYNCENRAQQLKSLRKKNCDYKESAGHKAALKILAEANKETLENICLKTLSREKVIVEIFFVLHIKLQNKISHLTILNSKLTFKN
jgi:hypothetical protein